MFRYSFKSKAKVNDGGSHEKLSFNLLNALRNKILIFRAMTAKFNEVRWLGFDFRPKY